MLAAKFRGIEDVRVEEVAVPQIGAGDVLVKTGAAGICTSDLEAYRIGHGKLADYCPESSGARTPGHEFAGEVVAVGAEVKGICRGLRVAIAPNYGCGMCRWCRKGIYPLCRERRTIGLDVDGGFAEYVRIPGEAVRQGVVCAFSEELAYEEAALNEPLACAHNGMMKCRLQPGEVMLIAGGGPAGMMHLALARLAGAGKVIVAEPSEWRREEAKRFGADAVLNPEDKGCAAAVAEETGGRGADVIIVACGSPAAQETALTWAAVHGRINFFGKVPKERELIGFNSNLVYRKELSVHGSYGSRPDHFALTLHLLDSRKIDLRALITSRFAIGDMPRAYEAALSDTMTGKGMKTVIRFS